MVAGVEIGDEGGGAGLLEFGGEGFVGKPGRVVVGQVLEHGELDEHRVAWRPGFRGVAEDVEFDRKMPGLLGDLKR